MPRDPLDAPGSFSIGAMQVEVIDGVDDFVALMQELFELRSDPRSHPQRLPAGL